MMKKTFMVLLCGVGLWSCSSSEPDTTQANKTENNNNQEHMLSDQQRMIQKAKDAEKLVKEADEKRRKALAEQGG